MQADAVHGWSVQGLGGATYRKVGSALHGFQSAIAAFLPCHTTVYAQPPRCTEPSWAARRGLKRPP